MSPLWKNEIVKKQKTIHKRPSPKHSHRQNFAQSLLTVQARYFPKPLKMFDSIKGISLFISKGHRADAGMTVEASVVLPLFIFFFLNLSSAIEMIRLHGNLQLALWEVGNCITIYGGMTALEEAGVVEKGQKELTGARNAKTQETNSGEDSWWKELAGVVGAYTYVKAQISDYLGEDYLESSPLKNGVNSLQFLESNVYESEDCFEVVVTYSVSPISKITGFIPFRMANRYYGHLWNGYEIPEGEMFVYIAENGRVYHTNRECTHLQLSVKKVDWREACDSRNGQGEKYIACEKCVDSVLTEEVYITEEGKCYHGISSCAGLKRTIICVPISEVEKWSLCLRCGREAE